MKYKLLYGSVELPEEIRGYDDFCWSKTHSLILELIEHQKNVVFLLAMGGDVFVSDARESIVKFYIDAVSFFDSFDDSDCLSVLLQEFTTFEEAYNMALEIHTEMKNEKQNCYN